MKYLKRRRLGTATWKLKATCKATKRYGKSIPYLWFWCFYGNRNGFFGKLTIPVQSIPTGQLWVFYNGLGWGSTQMTSYPAMNADFCNREKKHKWSKAEHVLNLTKKWPYWLVLLILSSFNFKLPWFIFQAFVNKYFLQVISQRLAALLELVSKVLRFDSSCCSIWTSYTSFESSWPANFDYLSFGSIPWRCVMLKHIA